jgi:hypothetical protein
MTRRRKGAVRARTSKRSARRRRPPSASARAELEAMTHSQLMTRWNELAVAGMKAGIKGVAQHTSPFETKTGGVKRILWLMEALAASG